jgi:hypothetical protein
MTHRQYLASEISVLTSYALCHPSRIQQQHWCLGALAPAPLVQQQD